MQLAAFSRPPLSPFEPKRQRQNMEDNSNATAAAKRFTADGWDVAIE
jgi:hypothetical protein